MAGRWKESTLGELLDAEGGDILTGPFGTALKAAEYSSFGVPVVSVTEIGFGQIKVHSRTPRVPPVVTERLPKYLLAVGDIVFARKGAGTAVERSAIVSSREAGWFLGSDSIRIRLPKSCSPRFISYWLQSKAHRNWMKQHSVGTTMPALNQGIISRIPVSIPPLPEQRAIAHILATLDDKIELILRMNQTLEAMARALFKSWFVDFDPVRAKVEGRDPGLPKSFADLFPDSFEDQKLGRIPKGWGVKRLGDLLELAYGKALKAEDRQDGNVPVYGSNGQVGWHNERLVTGPGIVVGRKGNPGIATWVATDFFPIDTTFYVLPKANCRYLEFLFHVLRTHNLASLGADSAVPGLNRNLAYMSDQILPPTRLLEQFERLAGGLSRRVNHGIEESRLLGVLRDTLLPKLIFGEKRVPCMEHQL